MEFGKREIDFEEADRRYAELRRRRDAGVIGDEEFDAQRQQLMVRDGEGRWWAKGRATDEWYYRDEDGWVRETPPDYRRAGFEEPTETAGAEASVDPRRQTGRGTSEFPAETPERLERGAAPRSRARAGLTVGVGAFLVLLLVALGAVGLTVGTGAGSKSDAESGTANETIPVPDFAGQTEDEAESSAGGDFGIEIIDSRPSEEPEDVILSQEPQAGEQVAPGTTVSVVVSAGEPEDETIPIPDFVGQTEDEAESSAGGDFGIEIVDSRPSEEPEAVILSQEPQAGEQALPGAVVYVIVSTGESEAEEEKGYEPGTKKGY